MKITLIEPAMIKTHEFGEKPSWVLEPLTLATLAGLTPPGIEVQAIDDRIEDVDYDEPRDLVGISVKTFNARRAYQIAAEFRRRGVPVILGGYHPTLAPEEALQFADSILVGEAEGVWGQVIQDVANRRLQKLYRQEQSAELNQVTPNRSVFAGKRYLPVAIVESARGCPFYCRFCAVSVFSHRTVRHRPISEVVAEVATVRDRLILFTDDNVVANHAAAKALFRALIPLHIRWIGQASLTMVRDVELMQLLQKSGCVGLLIGIESLSSAGLQHLDKSWNTSQIGYDRALEIVRDHGIAVLGSFIIGTDDDTPASVDEMLRFALRHKLFAALFNMLIPYPGTPLYADLQQEGRLLKPQWWLDPAYTHGAAVFQPKRMSVEELERGWLKLNHDFYSGRAIWHRLKEPHVNARDLWHILTFLQLNLPAYKEEMQRYGKHLGTG
jgi:radical SAM superfamily enzyme YgiQ (UPF0313 family)